MELLVAVELEISEKKSQYTYEIETKVFVIVCMWWSGGEVEGWLVAWESSWLALSFDEMVIIGGITVLVERWYITSWTH